MSKSTNSAAIEAGLAKRHRQERRFRAYGLAALGFAGLMLVVLLVSIVRPGIGGFTRHELRLEVNTGPIIMQLKQGASEVNFHQLAYQSVEDSIADKSLNAAQHRQLLSLAGTFAAFDIKHAVLADKDVGKMLAQPMPSAAPLPPILTVWVPLADNADQFLKGHIDRHIDPSLRALNDQQIGWLDQWQKNGRIRSNINWDFFGRGDSRAPEAAGFLGSVVGSLLTLFICLGVALPVAVMAAITLEEFAKKTRVAEWLEIIINNLAAVPSIIYGLLGLSIYLQLFGMPRSSALVGGLTLAMLIMPVMIIAARASIRAVPPSMRLAAAGLGATPLQVVRHHVLPYAMPGILTGTILSICRALGETAPLLMIGMVAFVADIPRGPTDPATSMPVEIYLWASSPELGFIEKTSSAIIVLLVILLLLNGLAIRLRNRTQLTWQ